MPPPFDILPHLFPGLKMTVLITLGGAVVAIVCAVTAGLMRRSEDDIVRWFAILYVETFRGAPALVLLFWGFFALPDFGIRVDAVTVGIVVLGLNVGAYGAEVVRSSIDAVDPGQYRAAKALNLTPWQTMWHIILPQAWLMMLPPMGNLLIELLKGTALVSLITVTDLTRAGLQLRADTHRTFSIFAILLVIYFLLSLAITAAVRLLERKLSHGLDYGGRR